MSNLERPKKVHPIHHQFHESLVATAVGTTDYITKAIDSHLGQPPHQVCRDYILDSFHHLLSYGKNESSTAKPYPASLAGSDAIAIGTIAMPYEGWGRTDNAPLNPAFPVRILGLRLLYGESTADKFDYYLYAGPDGPRLWYRNRLQLP